MTKGQRGSVVPLPETTGFVLDAVASRTTLFLLVGGEGLESRVFTKPTHDGKWSLLASLQGRWPARSGGISVFGSTIAVNVGYGRVAGLDAELFETQDRGRSWKGPFDSTSLDRPTIGDGGRLFFNVSLDDVRLNPPKELGMKTFQGHDVREFDVRSEQFGLDLNIARGVQQKEKIRYAYERSEWNPDFISVEIRGS